MNQADALLIVKNTLGISADHTANDSEINRFLEQSKGKDENGNDYYRPYIIAAYMLSYYYAIQRQLLESADGAKWLEPQQVRMLQEDLIGLQRASDCGVTDIKDCWSTEAVKEDLNLSNAKGITGIVV